MFRYTFSVFWDSPVVIAVKIFILCINPLVQDPLHFGMRHTKEMDIFCHVNNTATTKPTLIISTVNISYLII
jgi:hypothetical protein